MQDFERMIDANARYERPKEQWWLEMKEIAVLMAKLGPAVRET
jgi:hypothetical protein